MEILTPGEARSIEQLMHAIADLRDEAKAGGYPLLAYFLEMARTEAEIAAATDAAHHQLPDPRRPR